MQEKSDYHLILASSEILKSKEIKVNINETKVMVFEGEDKMRDCADMIEEFLRVCKFKRDVRVGTYPT